MTTTDISQPTVSSSEKTNPKREIDLRTLLESGAHFGSKTSDWHPKMSSFIYGRKKDIYIINLEKTVKIWHNFVRPAIVEMAANGKTILFVGTKKPGRDALTEHAARAESPYVNEKWRAGLLTNFNVVRKSVDTLLEYEEIIRSHAAGEVKKYNKQELNKISKEITKLNKDFNGIRNLKKLPDMIFVTDAENDALAIEEAKKMDIKVVALVDTNVDPTTVDFPLPANDDAVKTLTLFINVVADAIVEGKETFRKNNPETQVEEAPAPETMEQAVKVAEESKHFVEKKGKTTTIQVEKVSKKKKNTNRK